MSCIGRRKFVMLLSGAAAWPLAARAQEHAMPVVAFITGGSPDSSARLVAAFRKGLGEIGYVEANLASGFSLGEIDSMLDEAAEKKAEEPGFDQPESVFPENREIFQEKQGGD